MLDIIRVRASMSIVKHQIFAHKYRPQNFKEVIAQENTVQTLQNALRSGRIAPAYLLFGARGVGKTSIARIMAKSLNCRDLQKEKNEPCNSCEMCEMINKGTCLDVIEIDGASNRGINQIRELRENVKFQTVSGFKKIYIIDEVHMLTTESFNALLKTLEEPPGHVIFILATTEFHKIPDTILSRCQTFHLAKASLQQIEEHLQRLCEHEEILFDQESLFWIAKRGDGSVRDSLSFLEQAVVFTDASLTKEKVQQLIGEVPTEKFLELTDVLLNSDENEINKKISYYIQELSNTGQDFSNFLWSYLDFLRVCQHIQKGIESIEILKIPQLEIQALKEKIQHVETHKFIFIFQYIYKLIAKFHKNLKFNRYETSIIFEAELLYLYQNLMQPSLKNVLEQLDELALMFADTNKASLPANPPATPPITTGATPTSAQVPPPITTGATPTSAQVPPTITQEPPPITKETTPGSPPAPVTKETNSKSQSDIKLFQEHFLGKEVKETNYDSAQ